MASHSLPVPVPQARERSQVHVTSRLPSLRVAIAVFAALLILFGWLHLLVAMQTAATERLILNGGAQLDILERETQALLLKIAEGESPRAMAPRVGTEGYVLQEPLYLELSQPTVPSTEGQIDQAPFAPSNATEQTAASQPSSLLESIFGNLQLGPEIQP